MNHTFVVSDIHLSDAEPPHPRNPFWKRFKRPAHFVDRTFRRFLGVIQEQAKGAGPIELVFNGDIFDFDSVMVAPEDAPFPVSWLERRRGLHSDEPKSRYKIGLILKDHPIFFAALRAYILSGNRAVFVIGNHDLELHWESVQQDVLAAIGLEKEIQERVRFCDWFYVSNEDTLIEHSNQYDAYSMTLNPVRPFTRLGERIFLRVPFANLAARLMVNGMGLFNPHANTSFIKSSFKEYAIFYFRYMLRTQPLIMISWFWSALATAVLSVRDAALPAIRDPLTLEARINSIAERANSTPGKVLALKELMVHPAVFNPLKILQELWLDRAILLGVLVFGSFQLFSFLNVFVTISPIWFFVFVALFLPRYIFYAKSVQSEVDEAQRNAITQAPRAAMITGVSRVVHGHTHIEMHLELAGATPDEPSVDYLNTGTWSAAYSDVECTEPFGRKCFAWIKPGSDGKRVAELYEWTGRMMKRLERASANPVKTTSDQNVA